MLLIRLQGGLFVRLRCRDCADAPVPADLPPLQDPVGPQPTLKSRHRDMNVLPLDFKTAACGEREPGEDG